MSEPLKYDQLVALLKQAAEAHHAAYAATDGTHADWPMWYAEYLHGPLGKLLDARFTQSELIYLIVGLDKELQKTAPGASWTAFWAKSLLERYG